MSLDVLLIAPQPEEAHACRLWLPKKLQTLNAEPVSGVERYLFEDLSVGLYLIHAMGSVSAALRCQPVIRQYSPKVVILVGIAAAMEGTLNVGDVCYNEEVYYYSYGKIRAGRARPEIRAVPPVQRNDQLLRCAKAIDARWADEAKSLFDECRESWVLRFKYPEQRWPAMRPVARTAQIASGELVVASEHYQQHVRSFFRAQAVSVFEMEAYAIGKLSEDSGCQFITIRGVSDNGGAAKDHKSEKDKDRLCATLVSAVFSKALLKQEAFKQLLSVSEPPRARTVSCLHPRVSTVCPSERRCVDIGFAISLSKNAPLTRVYEDVAPMSFSQDFARHINGDTALPSMTFFFPYSPVDLLRFFDRHLEGVAEYLKPLYDWNDNAGKANWVPSTREQLAFGDALSNVARLARTRFPHFRACVEKCERLREEMLDDVHRERHVAQRMSRIIVLPDLEAKALRTNPLRDLYHSVLGENVPTFIVGLSNLRQQKLPVDDFTFFHDESVAGPDQWLTTLRFFENSQLLIVSGWPCSSTGLDSKTDGLAHLRLLYRRWRDDLVQSRVGTADSIFEMLTLSASKPRKRGVQR